MPGIEGEVIMETYDEMVNECAVQAKALMHQMANNGTLEPLYLYARKSTETADGKLFMVRQSAPNPPGYELVSGEGLRINVPYDQYFNWIWKRARSAPIMCWGKQA